NIRALRLSRPMGGAFILLRYRIPGGIYPHRYNHHCLIADDEGSTENCGFYGEDRRDYQAGQRAWRITADEPRFPSPECRRLYSDKSDKPIATGATRKPETNPGFFFRA